MWHLRVSPISVGRTTKIKPSKFVLHSIQSIGRGFHMNKWISTPMVHVSTLLTYLLIGHHVLLSFSCVVLSHDWHLLFHLETCKWFQAERAYCCNNDSIYNRRVCRLCNLTQHRSSIMCIMNACLCAMPRVSQNQVTSDLKDWDLFWCYSKVHAQS